MKSTKDNYRIITNCKVYRIELYGEYIQKHWFKPDETIKWSVPCDNVGRPAVDDFYGDILPEEIVEYDTLEEAKQKIKDWTEHITNIPDEWSVVWQTSA